jgi:hypothetical protein
MHDIPVIPRLISAVNLGEVVTVCVGYAICNVMINERIDIFLPQSFLATVYTTLYLSPICFSMKMAESRKIVLGNCLIHFDQRQFKGLKLKSQSVQSYGLLEIFRPNYGEDCHCFTDIRTQN